MHFSKRSLIVALFMLFIVSAAFAQEEAPHWTYEGEEGPEHWGEHEVNATCSTGVEQSPIDLVNAVAEDVGDVVFSYQPSKINIFNNGHTIQQDYDTGSSITIGDTVYNLAQFHFHTPSEHAVNGELMPLEMHLVHRSEAGNLAVVGVMLVEGEENPVIAELWSHLPTIATERRTIDAITFNAADLLPRDVGNYFRYNGSLTTPPCSEGVLWTVMDESITVSAEQIEAFHAVFELNARPVQPLGERELINDTGN